MDGNPAFPGIVGDDWLANRQGRLVSEQIKRFKLAAGSLVAMYLVPCSLLTVVFQSMDRLRRDLDVLRSPLLRSLGISSIILSWIVVLAVLVLMYRNGFLWLRCLREATRGVVLQAEGALRWRGRRYVAEAGSVRLRTVPGIVEPLPPGPYRFYYLPKTRVVAAAEWLGDPVPFADAYHRVLPAGFSASALPFNRGGRLSPNQPGGPLFGIVGVFTIVFLGTLAAPLIVPNPFAAYLRIIMPLLISIYLVCLMNMHWFTDLRAGRVTSVEGVIRRDAHQKDTGAWVYTFTVAGQTFRVSKVAYNALDGRYLYRLYITVRGHRLLHIEPVGEVQSAPPGEGDALG